MAAKNAALIAVVDEDPVFVELLGEIFADEGYRLAAYTRVAALTQLRHDRPALLVLDLHHGQWGDGWAFLTALRRDPAARDLPIIVCSTDEVVLWARARCLREQRCAILPKPFDLDALLTLVRAVLSGRCW